MHVAYEKSAVMTVTGAWHWNNHVMTASTLPFCVTGILHIVCFPVLLWMIDTFRRDDPPCMHLSWHDEFATRATFANGAVHVWNPHPGVCTCQRRQTKDAVLLQDRRQCAHLPFWDHWARRWIYWRVYTTHGQCDAGPTVTFPAKEHFHCPLAGIHFPSRRG